MNTLVRIGAVAILGTLTSSAQQSLDGPIAVLQLTAIFTDIYMPAKVKTNERGFYFVMSSKDHSIAIFDRQRKFVRRVAVIGQGPGELYNPVDFALGADDKVWVADRDNNRIQIFDRDGRIAGQIK